MPFYNFNLIAFYGYQTYGAEGPNSKSSHLKQVADIQHQPLLQESATSSTSTTSSRISHYLMPHWLVTSRGSNLVIDSIYVIHKNETKKKIISTSLLSGSGLCITNKGHILYLVHQDSDVSGKVKHVLMLILKSGTATMYINSFKINQPCLLKNKPANGRQA